MGDVVLTLGSVAFQDFEVPEKISFGGAQRLAVHELIGAGRVVDALGIDDGKILFGGIFSGDDAQARAQEMDAARALGAALPMVWDNFFYTVTIEEFSAVYEKPWWIPFRVCCVVVNDPVAALVAPVASLVSADLAAAALFGPQAGIGVGLLATASAGGLAAAQAAIAGGMTATGANVVGSGVAVGAAMDAAGGITGVQQASRAAGQLAGLASMSGYVNRAAANLAGTLV